MSAMKIYFKLPSAAKYYANRLKLIYRTCLNKWFFILLHRNLPIVSRLDIFYFFKKIKGFKTKNIRLAKITQGFS